MVATCQCCGHGRAQAHGDTRTHFVADDLLECFNRAHEDAEWRGMGEVEVANLLLAICTTPDLAVTVTICGVDPAILISVVEAGLPLRSSLTRRSLPRTSADLKLLLEITQRSSDVRGEKYMSVRSILSTLLALPSALTCVQQLSRWFWASRRHPGSGPAASPLPLPQPSAHASVSQAPDLGWLQTRLDRQDELLSTLREQLRVALVKAAEPSPVRVELPKLAEAPPPRPVKVERAEDTLDEEEDIDEEEAFQTGIKRYYLSMDDDIVRAPSIGPATAARLQPHGVTHVKHLLACDPERLSARLGARHLTASRIAAWKNQARLVCSIPWLRGTHAQLLVGAGYASIDKILSAERTTVCAAILQFATTRDGQSILRNGQPPDMERIMRWIENSQHAEPQRAEPQRTIRAVA